MVGFFHVTILTCAYFKTSSDYFSVSCIERNYKLSHYFLRVFFCVEVLRFHKICNFLSLSLNLESIERLSPGKINLIERLHTPYFTLQKCLQTSISTTFKNKIHLHPKKCIMSEAITKCSKLHVVIRVLNFKILHLNQM